MPNLVDNTATSSVVGYPMRPKATIDFMQYFVRDTAAQAAMHLIGSRGFNPAKSYILSGCEVTSDGTNTTVSAGYVFGITKAYGSLVARSYIYFCEGQTFPDPTTGVIIGKVIGYPQSYADPTPFTDMVNRDIHINYLLEFSEGVAASGDIDYTDLIPVEDKMPFLNIFGDVESTDYKFTRNASWWYNSAFGGVPTLTFNLENAIVGKEVIIHSTYDVTVGVPATVAYNLVNGFPGAPMMIFELGDANPEITTPPTAFTIKIKYLGLKSHLVGSEEEAFEITMKWFY